MNYLFFKLQLVYMYVNKRLINHLFQGMAVTSLWSEHVQKRLCFATAVNSFSIAHNITAS